MQCEIRHGRMIMNDWNKAAVTYFKVYNIELNWIKWFLVYLRVIIMFNCLANIVSKSRSQATGSCISNLIARQTCMAQHPEKDISLNVVAQNISKDWMGWCVPMQTLQGILGVYAYEVTLPRLPPSEEKGSLYGTEFGCMNTAINMKVVGEKAKAQPDKSVPNTAV